MKEEETRVSEILQYYLDGYGMSIFGCVSLISNFISALVHLKYKGRSTFDNLVIMLSVSDLLFVLVAVTEMSLITVFQWPIHPRHPLMFLLTPKFFYPMKNILSNLSMFLTLSIAIERYMAVCKPLTHRDLKGTFLGSAWIHLIVSTILALGINVTKWFETTVKERSYFLGGKYGDRSDPALWKTKLVYRMTDMRASPYYVSFGMVIPRWVFQMLAPLILLTIFSILTGIKLREFLARSENRKEVRPTLITGLLILEFILLNIPRYILIISEALLNTKTPPDWFFCLMSVNNLLQILNTNMNFFFYAVMNKNFRNGLKSLFFRRCQTDSQGPIVDV
ncbi:FMRFamide receptor [Eurytemora carolleeae]|uniref:FMRFamide receptor n=1 Tax=Eurytemora carolleeae TaxID=1294199 RepID=UPI000C77D09D|nr:FMRFamide receptor [Eurytemora carolleeae]|eukprot:XP_023338303.1 FMRFamide receptor-like [Eurytemora affinis]